MLLRDRCLCSFRLNQRHVISLQTAPPKPLNSSNSTYAVRTCPGSIPVLLRPSCCCRIVAAWAGDSRAVVGTRRSGQSGGGYEAHELTADHKPDSPSELARIAAAGGRIDRLATDHQGNPTGERALGEGAIDRSW